MIKQIISIFTSFLVTVSFFSINTQITAENKDSTEASDSLCSVLIEASSGTVLQNQNAYKKVPVGTLNKLMTIFLVGEKIESGKLSLDDKVKASSYANTMQGAQIWLMPGEEMTVSDLLKSVIIGNANDASVALAEKIAYTEQDFTKLMNEKASEIGMKSTTFTNCNGYYDDEKQISTAYDVALLSARLSEFEFLQEYFTTWLDYVRGKDTELVNSNKLVNTYKGIIGFKASYTKNSENCIAVGAKRDNCTYIAVVLNCKDKDIMFSHAKSLLNTGFSYYQIITPKIPSEFPDRINVKSGVSKSSEISVGKMQNIVIPVGSYKNVSCRIILPDYIYAPVHKGGKIGEIQYYLNDDLLYKNDIISYEEIEKMDFFKALATLLKSIVKF